MDCNVTVFLYNLLSHARALFAVTLMKEVCGGLEALKWILHPLTLQKERE
jgi:hypothetical protein